MEATKLWPTAVYGPVTSRRLGRSLGINLMSTERKVCSFDCRYCECGLTAHEGLRAAELPTRLQLRDQLRRRLEELNAQGDRLDVITFAGNGEPTLHPVFDAIVEDTLELRDELAPGVRIVVLTNGTGFVDARKALALTRVDECAVKIDSGRQATIVELDRPRGHYSLSMLVEHLLEHRQALGDRLTVQTMFCAWTDEQGRQRDNASTDDVEPWLDLLRRLQPARLQIYTVSRPTPGDLATKIDQTRLNGIRDRARTIVPLVTVAY